MTVYVDDMNLRADVPNGDHTVRGKWSHLTADSEAELRAFAKTIRLRQEWIQHPGEPSAHFDVTASKRKLAIEKGAQPITWRESGQRHAASQKDASRKRYLLVSGPREGVSRETVAEALRPHFDPAVTLLAGGARGVDTDAARLWREWGGQVEEDKVTSEQWLANPQGAGFARNDRMVRRVRQAQGKALVVDLPCSRPGCRTAEPHNTQGTSQCAQSARQAGLEVTRYPAPAQARTPDQPQRAAQTRRDDTGRLDHPADDPDAPRPAEGRVRHSWGEITTDDGRKVCVRRGCGMEAEQRWNPATSRPLVIYSKDGQRLVSERVPPCGSELPGGEISTEERKHLAEAADRQAAEAYKAGDLDRAFRLLTDARCLDPERSRTWDEHEKRLKAKASQRQPGAEQPEPEKPHADPAVIEAETQQWAHWNAELPKGLCGPEWHRCTEHGVNAPRERAQQAAAEQAAKEGEGAA